ncbi:MAG: hypothetical protein HYV02_01365 [Deltaproteobacteria bacterium]|nr:hypothetical protein [Deltaproteobacteria bacterium]
MKGFYFDTILDAENICNLHAEQKALWDGIERKAKLVVYGHRNSGKTSLLKSVIIPKFRRKHKRAFVLFVDVMEVKTLASIHERIRNAFGYSFGESFPGKQFLTSVKQFLRGLRPQISVDEVTGLPTLTLGNASRPASESFSELFAIIRGKIAPQVPTLVVFDEFQDIALVEEAQGLMRQALQEFRDTPLIVMGSKQHLLAGMLAKPNAPLAGFGEDIAFGPIPYREYYHYMAERFAPHKIQISSEGSVQLQDLLHRNPEAINMVCATLVREFTHHTVTGADLHVAIDRTVENRRSRYETYLAQCSAKEERLLIVMAKETIIRQPTGKSVLKNVSVSPRGMQLIMAHLLNRSIVERSDRGYQLSDPLFQRFLQQFR